MLLPQSMACTFSLYSHIIPLFLITLCLWSQTCLSNQHWLPLMLIQPIRGAFWLANQTQHATSECVSLLRRDELETHGFLLLNTTLKTFNKQALSLPRHWWTHGDLGRSGDWPLRAKVNLRTAYPAETISETVIFPLPPDNHIPDE